MAEETPRYALVTGGNRGIGFEICRQLANKGIRVILTSRDENRGLEAVEILKKELQISDQSIVFHQLDVSDPASVTSIAEFVKTQFGKGPVRFLIQTQYLDADEHCCSFSAYLAHEPAAASGYRCKTHSQKKKFSGCVYLINNAGVIGIITDVDALRAGTGKEGFNWEETITETYELAEECIRINYYGPKRMCEALIPLLKLSDSPRIVNVSSFMGQLKNLLNEWAKGILSDAENLTEERIDQMINQLLNDLKEDTVKTKDWAKVTSAYVVSKAGLNGYTRILAKKHPEFRINSVCPGIVKTDMTFKMGDLSVEEGASSPVRLALLPHQETPSGCFFDRKQVSEF